MLIGKEKYNFYKFICKKIKNSKDFKLEKY